MKIIQSWLAILVALLAGCVSFPEPYVAMPGAGTVLPVVAVSSFDNRSGFEGQWALGSGMADLLVSELVASRSFTVLERKQIDAVMGEIDMQRDSHFRTEGRVESGRLKNARYLIRGVINDFSQVGGGALSVALRALAFGGRGYKAKVALTLTIVEVETGQIIDSVQCSAVAAAGEAYGSATYRNVAFGGDAFFKTPLGSATAKAIRKGVNSIMLKLPCNMWEPMIAEVDAENGRLILNGGTDRDFKVGALYEVRGEGRVITDPATGDRLTVLPGPSLGTVRIVKADRAVSFAQIVAGTGFKRGQRLIRQ